MKVYPFIKTVFSFILHIGALLMVFLAFLPVAKWYFYHRPILGVDFFNTATYVKFFHDHFHILPYGFRYFWYGGSPIAEDIIISWFLPYSFFARIFPLIESVKIGSLFFFSVLLLFVYLASFRLSKNQFVSALITILVTYSANMYGSLVWGGSLPYFANQLFFPAVLWLLASYLHTGNSRWYWASVLVVGLSFLGHLANGGAFVFIGSVLLLLFGTRTRSVRFLSRIGEIAILFIVSYLFSYRTADRLIGLAIQTLKGGIPSLGGSAAKVSISGGGIAVTGDSSLISFERSRFLTLFSDTYTFLFFLFGIAFLLCLLGFVVDRHKRNVFSVVVWLMLASYSVVQVFLNAYGISFLSQAWYRAFWHFPITLGLATAALMGYCATAFGSLFTRARGAFLLISSIVAIGVLTGLFYTNASRRTIQVLETRSSPSSAHPEAINLVRNQKELDMLKSSLVPSWLDPQSRDYRLFTSDAQVNVWWNALFAMPLVRWYIDPPVGGGLTGHHFLLDQAVAGDGLVTNFKYDQDVARNMALYYLDWYAVRYLEGGRLSKSPNKGVSSYLQDTIEHTQDVAVKGAYILYQTESGKPEVWEHVPQYLKYYQFRDELVTPILSLNNSPAVLCFCNWPAYESVTKVLAMHNMSSQFLVTVFYPEAIDSLPVQDLSHFDAVLLIDYTYRSKDRAFSTLTKYVENGGRLFIDTGSEVAESTAEYLPEMFPFRSAQRGGLGREWSIETSNDLIFDNIDVEAFSPPVYNKSEWKFSYPISDVGTPSQILLSNHGKPLLIRKHIGRGQVVWSGMNLAYHVHANTNVRESKFFVNILQSFVPLTHHAVDEGEPQFLDDRRVAFVVNQTGRGILFKEHLFPGWKVHVNGKETKAYKAGPTFPGFIYVPLGGESNGPVKAEFAYWGYAYHYIPRIFTFVVGLFLLEQILFDGFFLGRRISSLAQQARKRIGKWWQREEE